MKMLISISPFIHDLESLKIALERLIVKPIEDNTVVNKLDYFIGLEIDPIDLTITTTETKKTDIDFIPTTNKNDIIATSNHFNRITINCTPSFNNYAIYKNFVRVTCSLVIYEDNGQITVIDNILFREIKLSTKENYLNLVGKFDNVRRARINDESIIWIDNGVDLSDVKSFIQRKVELTKGKKTQTAKNC